MTWRVARVAQRIGHAFWLAGAAFMLLSAPARAGHAPLVPEPRTILLRADDPSHVVIGARRGGYFVTRDAGATWSWMCEAGVGYDDEEVYPGALLPGGTLVVSTGFGGVAASEDGCGFTPWLPSAQPFVADVRGGPSARGGVLALEGRAAGDAFVNQLWQSADGLGWQAFGAPFAAPSLAASFAVTKEGELFVGVTGPAGAELLRSADDGETWEHSLLTAEPGAVVRVVGAENGRVFVVLDFAQVEGATTTADRVLLSADGGQTFSTLLEASGDLSSSSLSTDGTRLAVGGHSDGIHLLQNASRAEPGATMTRVWERSVHALAWSAAGRLYAAGHEAVDGFSVGVSDDDGRSFQPVFALCQVQGPLACAASSSVGAQCLSAGETGWDVRREVVDGRACGAAPEADIPEPEPRASSLPPPAAADARSGGCAVIARTRHHGGLAALLLAVAAALRKALRRTLTAS